MSGGDAAIERPAPVIEPGSRPATSLARVATDPARVAIGSGPSRHQARSAFDRTEPAPPPGSRQALS
jgi:hypothetical protein